MRYEHLDLFSGIGGFAIAAQCAGFRTIGFCESDSRCADFLRSTWNLPVARDIRKLRGADYRGIALITGGPPCQPASRAGEQRGEGDDRWLWPEAIRIVAETRPLSFLFENPPGILDVGIDGILDDLEALGYEVAPPLEIPACAVGLDHQRARYWILKL